MCADRLALVYTTLANPEQARQLGNALIREKLAACVNIFPGMISIYEWQGVLEETSEAAMIIKTRTARLDALMARAHELHPYDTPALLVIPVEKAPADFTGWVSVQTEQP